jgi:type IV secretory pathway VirJ component
VSQSPPLPAQAPTQDAAPPSAETLVRLIIGLAARLGELMIKETALLSTGHAREIGLLTKDKGDLARAYAGRWAQLQAVRGDIEALPPSLVAALRTQVTQLSVIATENEKALRVAQTAANRVLGIITRAVREQHNAGIGYTRSRQQPRRQAGLLGVALDRSL